MHVVCWLLQYVEHAPVTSQHVVDVDYSLVNQAGCGMFKPRSSKAATNEPPLEAGTVWLLQDKGELPTTDHALSMHACKA
jgi:hypothetical protein